MNVVPRPLLAFLFASVALAPAAYGAAANHFTVEQVMSAPFATSPVPAPTGAQVAWLLNEQGRRNVWVASAPEGSATTALGARNRNFFGWRTRSGASPFEYPKS